MTYQSRWEQLPLDVLYQQILILEDPSDILTFCHDPYINSKICQDKNGLIWRLLCQRNLSDLFVLKVEETLMDQYLKVIQTYKTLNIIKRLYFVAENGYEKLLKRMSLSELSMDMLMLSSALQFASEGGHLKIIKFLIKKGADLHFNREVPLRTAAHSGQLEIVKY